MPPAFGWSGICRIHSTWLRWRFHAAKLAILPHVSKRFRRFHECPSCGYAGENHVHALQIKIDFALPVLQNFAMKVNIRRMPVRSEFTEREKLRFWSKVQKPSPTSCWNWNASLMGKSGYGQFSLRCCPSLAHRVSFQMEHEKSIEDKCVLHTCDNRRCVNPLHLFLGTYKDNSDDMKAKGRERKDSPQGERHSQAKLSEEKIREILKFPAHTIDRIIAEKYGVHLATINRIRNRQAWLCVKTSIDGSQHEMD